MIKRLQFSLISFSVMIMLFASPVWETTCEATGNQKTAASDVEAFLTPEQFGAAGDGVTDDTAAIQAMLDSCKDESVVTFRSGAQYLLTDTIRVKRFTSIDGNGCTFKMRGRAFSVDGFCFALNTDGITTRSINYKYRPFFRNCYIEADERYYGSNNGIVCSNHITIDHITFDKIDIAVKFTDDYIDMCEVSDIYIRGRKGNNFAIYGGKLGDGRRFSRISMGAGDNHKLLFVGNHHLMVTVSEIVGRNVIETGSPTYFEQMMLSSDGRIIVNGADCTFNNVYATMDSRTESAIEFNSTLTSEIIQEPHIKMSNCFFYVTQNKADTHKINPIEVNGCKSFTFENVLTGYVDAYTDAVAKTYAPITSTVREILIYNRFSHALNGKTVTVGQPISFAVDAETGETVLGEPYLAKGKQAAWSDDPGIYYYRLAIMPDDELLIGALSEEVSAIIRDSDCAICFSSQPENGFHGKRIRVFRGVKSDTYTKYADLYVLNSVLIDSGNSVNGILWENIEPETVPQKLIDGVEIIEYQFFGTKCHRELRSQLFFEENALSSRGFQMGDLMQNIGEPAGFQIFDGSRWVDVIHNIS